MNTYGWGRRSYYNWREGPWSDLQLFLLFNAAIILAGGLIKHSLLPRGALEGDADHATSNFFQDIYEVEIHLASFCKSCLLSHYDLFS